MTMRTARIVVSAVTGLILIAGCGAASPTARSGSAPVAASVPSSPCGHARIVDLGGSNASLTRQLASLLVASVPTTPGSTIVAHSPVAALNGPPQWMASSNLVTRTWWWRTPGTITTAEDYLNTHLPSSLRSSGSFGPGGSLGVQGLMYSHDDTPYAIQITVLVTFAQMSNGLGERIDAQAIYLPPCPNINALIPNPTGATVTIERSGRAPMRRNIDRAAAQQTVALLETLPPSPPSRYFSCPAQTGQDNDIVAFSTPRGRRTIRIDTTGCLGISFDQHPHTALRDSSGRLNALLGELLHLPATEIR